MSTAGLALAGIWVCMILIVLVCFAIFVLEDDGDET